MMLLSQESTRPGGSEKPVRRRRVLYVSGFDPRGPAFYHRFLRDEAAKHVALSGEPMRVGDRRTVSSLVHAWTVTAGPASDEVETSYEFLRWDDIIREHWPRNIFRVWAESIWATWVYIRAGITRAAFRTSFPIGITMHLPGLLILGQILLIALASALFVGALPRLAGLSWWAGAIPTLAAAVATVLLARRIDAKINAHWSGRIMVFTVRDARSQVVGFDARRQALADYLVSAVTEGRGEEILLVGHSLGTPLAVSVMALALERNPELGRMGPAVALLTLGQTTPMLALMPEAEWFRRHLRMAGIAGSSAVEWVDFTSPIDGACFALVDPVALANPDFPRPEGAEACPKLLNARLKELIEPATYAKVKRDWIRVHFQYLMAGDRMGEYDYFRIIGGPLTLRERYAHRESVTDFSRLRLFSA